MTIFGYTIALIREAHLRKLVHDLNRASDALLRAIKESTCPHKS